MGILRYKVFPFLIYIRSMEQDELVELVKNENDEEAFKQLIDEFLPLINSIMQTYELKYGDYLIAREDLVQEGRIGLLDACNSYVKNDLTKFSTFAYVVIKRKMNKAFYRLLHYYKDECLSFDRFNNLDHCGFYTTNYLVEEEEMEYTTEKEKTLSQLLNADFLTEEDKKIVELRLDGYSYGEIANKLGINNKRVDNRLARLKKRFKKRLNLTKNSR